MEGRAILVSGLVQLIEINLIEKLTLREIR